MSLQIGDRAPNFEGITQGNKRISLQDFAGRKVVLYFYPKDNTPGCTKQACNLRDNYMDIEAKGYSVIGVSQDSLASHERFSDKYALPFPLIADTDGQISVAYGVQRMLWFPKRTTFIIDEKGYIQNIITKVKTSDHTSQILT